MYTNKNFLGISEPSANSDNLFKGIRNGLTKSRKTMGEKKRKNKLIHNLCLGYKIFRCAL